MTGTWLGDIFIPTENCSYRIPHRRPEQQAATLAPGFGECLRGRHILFIGNSYVRNGYRCAVDMISGGTSSRVDGRWPPPQPPSPSPSSSPLPSLLPQPACDPRPGLLTCENVIRWHGDSRWTSEPGGVSTGGVELTNVWAPLPVWDSPCSHKECVQALISGRISTYECNDTALSGRSAQRVTGHGAAPVHCPIHAADNELYYLSRSQEDMIARIHARRPIDLVVASPGFSKPPSLRGAALPAAIVNGNIPYLLFTPLAMQPSRLVADLLASKRHGTWAWSADDMPSWMSRGKHPYAQSHVATTAMLLSAIADRLCPNLADSIGDDARSMASRLAGSGDDAGEPTALEKPVFNGRWLFANKFDKWLPEHLDLPSCPHAEHTLSVDTDADMDRLLAPHP